MLKLLAITFVVVLCGFFIRSYMLQEHFSSSGDVDACVGTSKKHSLYFFFMETCPHCIDFQPTWEDLTKDGDLQSKVCMAKISSDNDAMLQKYSVDAFPTLVLVNNAKSTHVTFNGKRTLDNVKQFVAQHTA